MARVLIVDDDAVMSEMVADWLKFEMHEVTYVQLGFEGWQKIQTNEYDLALLDWDLPDLNGIDILKRHRAAGGVTPVILLTGHTSADDKEQGLDLGANDYLTKPFHMKELSARIRAVLRNAAAAPPQKPLGSGNEEVLKRADLAGSALAARYEFIEVLGEGGVGIVFQARHPHLDKLVAIKMLQAAERNKEIVMRFEREARAISKLDHPNIVVVHDFGLTERKQPFMVMDFIEGTSLETLLHEEDILPLSYALNILVPVCDGLAHAHEKGIIHRDIKPGNIMLKESGSRPPVPKILDFGLAKLEEYDARMGVQLTQAQQVFGTPPYMSPEQVRGKAVDERSDIYSMGCVIFETITGYMLVDGESPQEIMLKHLEEQPATLVEARPEMQFPSGLQELISKALEKRPDARYQTMEELRDGLELIAQQVRTP